MARPVRVLLVDDESMFLDAVSALLEQDDRVEVVGTADNVQEALRLADAARPDVALVDLALPGVDGFEMTRLLLASEPAPRVIALSGLSTDEAERAALEAGATLFLFKGGLHHEIADAIVAASL